MLKMFRERSSARTGDAFLTMMWNSSSADMMDEQRQNPEAAPAVDPYALLTEHGALDAPSPHLIVQLGQRMTGADAFLLTMPHIGLVAGTEHLAVEVDGSAYRALEAAEVIHLANAGRATGTGYLTYAAVPVRGVNDIQIGTLVSLYRDDRPVSEKEISALKSLASAASGLR